MVYNKAQMGVVAIIIALVIVIILGVYLFSSGNFDKSQSSTTAKGRVVFTITDAAANLGSVNSVKVKVDEVQVHSNTKGWVTVSSTPKIYDLFELRNENNVAVLADIQLEEGTYQQMRLEISDVTVTDTGGSHRAKIPSGELKVVGNLNVEKNSTASATFDFILDESLHITGNNEYILAPVVQVETKNKVYVEIKSNNRAEIKGGNLNTRVKVGMDADGNVGVGLKIPSNIGLEIGSDNKIKVGGIGVGLGESSSVEEKSNADSNASLSGKTSVDLESGIRLG
ncbi:DUF4382 domain-containing protein [Candidatus Pacearchaeota archaeon]|nr:DUF4382 domain-containing protein [Candidatus Pacearchaeota archaeon]